MSNFIEFGLQLFKTANEIQTSVLPYTAHREIQELLCEIMDLCKAESRGENKE